jgi:hypothetical protein
VIHHDYFRLSHPAAPDAASYGTRARCEEWIARNPLRRPPETYAIDPYPCCECCGDSLTIERWEDAPPVGTWRCRRHVGRNPCAIEGCRCTTAAGNNGLRSDQYLCQKHWRPLTTPAERRVYSRIWRDAKARGRRLGREHMWSMREVRRLERVWSRLVAKARRRAAGDIDMTEINKMFGWDA